MNRKQFINSLIDTIVNSLSTCGVDKDVTLRINNISIIESTVGTLGNIGTAEAAGRLLQLLDDKNWCIVYFAVKCLGELKAVEAVDKLLQIYKDYPVADVRIAASYALESITSDIDNVKKLFS